MIRDIAQRLERSRLRISRRNLLGFQQLVKPEKLQVDEHGLLGKDRFLFGRSEFSVSLPDGQSTLVKRPYDIQSALDYEEQSTEDLEALKTLDSKGYVFDAWDKNPKKVDDEWTSLDAFVHDRGFWSIQSPDGVLTDGADSSIVQTLSARYSGSLPHSDRIDQIQGFEKETKVAVSFGGRDYKGLSEREKRAVAISQGESFSFRFGKDNWGSFEAHHDLKDAWSHTLQRAERLRRFDPQNQPQDSAVEYMSRRGTTYARATGDQLEGFDTLATRLEEQQVDGFELPIRNVLENIAQKGFSYQVAESNLDSFDNDGNVKADSTISRKTLLELSTFWKMSEALSMML